MSLFQPIASDLIFNPIPIVLIDVSGSTSETFTDGISVRCREIALARQVCFQAGYVQVNVISWSTEAELHRSLTLDQISDLKDTTVLMVGSICFVVSI